MNWWQRLYRGEQMEQELDKELRFHFEQQVADKVRAGMNESEARRTTRIEFGGLDQVITVGAQPRREKIAIGRVVINDEDARWTMHSPYRGERNASILRYPHASRVGRPCG